MTESKKHKKRILNSPVVRVLLAQLLIVVGLSIIDLYAFRGYYTSLVIVNSNAWSEELDYTCRLEIESLGDEKYLFTFRNRSITPLYFVNYRDEEHFQNVSDSLFFMYINNNLFPAYDFDYHLNFDCGTGLGFTSINPFESFEIKRSYQDIIDDGSYFHTLKKSEFFHEKSKTNKDDLNYEQVDSLLKYESTVISERDSIQIEYYMIFYTSLAKNQKYTLSNRVNVSIKDLLERYAEENSD